MKFRFGLAAVAAAFLAGCATPPQNPVSMGANTFAEPGLRVGVAMGKMPKVDTSFPGAGCLLCMAAASVANSSLTSHAQTLPSDDLARLKADIAEALKLKGQVPVVIEEAIVVGDLPNASSTVPNAARKDYSSLKSKYQLDKLVVVELTEIGITRPYSAYVPTGEPKSVVNGVSYIVNLKDNSYEWYLPIAQQKGAQGAWDEAPKYPGLSNAYFQVVEQARDSILQPLAN
jgi:hypothetical protein